MLSTLKTKTTRILMAIALTLLVAGAPIAMSTASAAGGSGSSGGTTITGG